MAANVLYLVALRHGLLAVVSAITGLYPAATVLLAQTVLDERMRRTQVAGLAVAAVAATLVAV
jgi:drug/metabolite transporter (DMT)-like permease